MKAVLASQSAYNVKETVNRLVIFLQSRRMTIYARIDHQAELRWFKQQTGAFEYLIFGDPNASGPLIGENPFTALDLPIRLIVWEDNKGKCWVAYKNSRHLMKVYGVSAKYRVWLDLEDLIHEALSTKKD